MSLVESSRDMQQMIIDIITDSVNGELLDLQHQSDECCIYRVPKRLRKVDGKVYTPQVVSIGPLHYGKEELKAMEEHKRRYLQCFLQLSRTVDVSDYVKFIMERETRLRNSYAETIELSSEELVKMVLIDATFIIMVMLYGTIIRLRRSNDRIFGKPIMIIQIRVDILLLENQLPFFILEDLFELSGIREHLPSALLGSEDVDLIKITYLFFQKFIIGKEILDKYYPCKVEHLLHFMRICYIPQKWHPKRGIAKTLKMPGAMELYQAGVEFKPSWRENLFDINFKDGTLEIPPLQIDDDTEIFFQNLCAFEQCHCRLLPRFYSGGQITSENEQCHCKGGLFSDYIVYMFKLANSSKDVEMLIKKGIIENRAYNSERVSSFFHNISAGLVISCQDFCYSNVIEDLNKHCATIWPKWKRMLKQDYFKTPWAIISVIAATILLALTVIQAACSILQVKYP